MDKNAEKSTQSRRKKLVDKIISLGENQTTSYMISRKKYNECTIPKGRYKLFY